MNFDNDPIGQKVEAEMRNLRQRGVQFADSSMYNRTFEAFYSLHQQLAQAEEKASVAPSQDEISRLQEQVKDMYYVIQCLAKDDDWLVYDAVDHDFKNLRDIAKLLYKGLKTKTPQ